MYKKLKAHAESSQESQCPVAQCGSRQSGTVQSGSGPNGFDSSKQTSLNILAAAVELLQLSTTEVLATPMFTSPTSESIHDTVVLPIIVEPLKLPQSAKPQPKRNFLCISSPIVIHRQLGTLRAVSRIYDTVFKDIQYFFQITCDFYTYTYQQ